MREKKTSSWKKPVLIVVCIVLALILALLIAATVFIESKLNLINRNDPANNETLSQEEIDKIENPEPDATDNGEGLPTIDEGDINWAERPEQGIGQDDHNIINILLIGQDRRPGQGRSRSDSMILCTFNKKANTLTLTSFMRDMYVQIPGYRDNKINTAYMLGGMELLNETLYVNFGVHVDANVEVDFSGFQKVIELMGGVEIELTSDEVWYLTKQNSDWLLRVGKNTLNGEQALAYSRIRYLDGADYARTQRQRNVLMSLVNSAKNMSLTEVNKMLDQILPLITTDMTNQEIVGYVLDLFPMLSSCEKIQQRIPADGTFQETYIRGMAVLLPDLEANRQILIDSLVE